MKFDTLLGTTTNKIEEIPWFVNEIQELYLGLAEKHLQDNPDLKAKILAYYSNTSRLAAELTNVFSGLDNEEIKQKIENGRKMLEDKALFVEFYEKTFERTDASSNARHLELENKPATDEEYELGCYSESLESQVREAVFTLQNKGYKSFASGFCEGWLARDQYIDFYNKKVKLPDAIVTNLAEKGFIVSLAKFDDRTKILVKPSKNTAVSLKEWKEIWDQLVDMMPRAEAEDLSDVEIYNLHSTFRKKQDELRSTK